MTLKTLMLLAATVIAMMLVGGCGGSQQEDQGSQSDSHPHGSSTSQDGSSSQEQSEVANIDSAGACAGSGDADRPQKGLGEASNGKIAFQRYPARGEPTTYRQLYIIDEDGTNETRLTNNALVNQIHDWSPDGQKIAFVGDSLDIYVIDADGTNERRLADNPARRFGPAWSPDGTQITFLRDIEGLSEVYVIDEDGTNETRLTKTDSVNSKPRTYLGLPVWSPDGNKIAFSSSSNPMTGSASASPNSAVAEEMDGIYVIDMDTAGLCKLTSTTDENTAAASPSWSPDGNKIAFYDNSAINVINADGSGRRRLTKTTTDPDGEESPSSPSWSPDGERIAFVQHTTPYPGLYVINADGSGRRRLTKTTHPLAMPVWSPDGEKIAFPCPAAPDAWNTDLCAMNADGTGWKRLALEVIPARSPVEVSWGTG